MSIFLYMIISYFFSDAIISTMEEIYGNRTQSTEKKTSNVSKETKITLHLLKSLNSLYYCSEFKFVSFKFQIFKKFWGSFQ